MSDKKVILSENDARKLFHDVLLSNVLSIVFALNALIQSPWLLLQIVLGLYTVSVVFHIFQVKKLLIKGKLFRFNRKAKKDDRSKGSEPNSGSK